VLCLEALSLKGAVLQERQPMPFLALIFSFALPWQGTHSQYYYYQLDRLLTLLSYA
jgi:hypothetical protein